jgi:hypothetical protein
MIEVNMFTTLFQLQNRLAQGQLSVTHAGYTFVASFEWFHPAGSEQIQAVEKQLSLNLPSDYNFFLGEISNGAVLYRDVNYSQWGFKLYGTTEIIEKQREWKKSLPFDWNPNLVAFGELFGESNVLVFDLSKLTQGLSNYAVLEGNPYDEFDDWTVISSSFHEWIDHLITAQGAKYWPS